MDRICGYLKIYIALEVTELNIDSILIEFI